MKLLSPKYFTPGLHLLVWALLLAIPTIVFHGKTYQGLTHAFYFLSALYHIGIFYLNAYFLYPRLLTKKTWWLYILAIVAIIILSYHAKLFLLQLNPGFTLTEDNRPAIIFGLIPFVIASTLFRLISDRLRFEKLEKEARAEHLAAELKFLRSQVSPHFLFNMMTNMVSLARQKSDLLEASLIKLSELLRYMLYDSTDEAIPLDKETEHLENYIALQQLRFGEDVKVHTEINNDCAGCSIEPMLLVPFIENAFKHGIGIVNEPFIDIQLKAQGHLLFFKVANSYSGQNFSKDKNSGIGLANVKNRLKLLYPGKYDLDITDENGIFSVELKLDLS